MTRTWTAVLARLGVPTGDGRIIAPAGGSSRDLPLPLLWQQTTGDGHGGSNVVGRIETLQIRDGMVTATGSLLESADYSLGVVEQLEAGVIGPSVDLDDIEYTMDDQERIVITKWRVAGATLVAIPAFADVSLTLDPEPAEPYPQEVIDAAVANDYMFVDEYLEDLRASAAPEVLPPLPEEWSGIYASAEPVVNAPPLPPLDWFRQPDLDRLTPLTISDSGRVFGHIAGWGQCHIGLPGCVTAPSSPSGYSYFHVAEQATAEGPVLPVGTLVAGPRHADPQAAFQAAQSHYDVPGAAVARVMAGEDEHGIWVAGWMLPGATEEAKRVFRSSPVSGDWRRIGGSLEMIAVCSVNAPGFPVPRARVAFSGGHQRTLIGSFGITPREGGSEHPDVSLFRDSWTGEITYRKAAQARWAWAMAQTGTEAG